MENIIDLGEFALTFPVWAYLGIDKEFRIHGAFTAAGPEGKPGVVLFTDRDQAESFPDERRKKLPLVALPDPFSLLGLLTVLEARGIPFVAIDPKRSATWMAILLLRCRLLRAMGVLDDPRAGGQ